MKDEHIFAGRRIVIAEDEVLIVMLLEQILLDAGGDNPVIAKTVPAALAALEAAPCDLLILDLSLCGMISTEVAIQALAADVPVLLSSGRLPDDLPPVVARLAFLRKPYQVAEVIDAVTKVLTGAQTSV